MYRPWRLEQTWIRNQQVGKLGVEVQGLEDKLWKAFCALGR